jgi:hypothetical protein
MMMMTMMMGYECIVQGGKDTKGERGLKYICNQRQHNYTHQHCKKRRGKGRENGNIMEGQT